MSGHLDGVKLILVRSESHTHPRWVTKIVSKQQIYHIKPTSLAFKNEDQKIKNHQILCRIIKQPAVHKIHSPKLSKFSYVGKTNHVSTEHNKEQPFKNRVANKNLGHKTDCQATPDCTPLCFCSVVNGDLKMVNGIVYVLKIFNHWQPLFFMPLISSEMNSLNSLCQTSGPALWWLPCKSVFWWKVFPDHLIIHQLKNIRHPLFSPIVQKMKIKN